MHATFILNPVFLAVGVCLWELPSSMSALRTRKCFQAIYSTKRKHSVITGFQKIPFPGWNEEVQNSVFVKPSAVSARINISYSCCLTSSGQLNVIYSLPAEELASVLC